MVEINTNFKGVIEKGDYESGDYTFEIKSAQPDTGPSGVYIRLALQFMDGKYAGFLSEEMVSFAEKALWRAKQFLRAVGYEIPDGPFRFNTDDLPGLVFKGHGEREVDPTGKYQPKLRITQFFNKDHQFTTVVPPATTTLAPETAASEPAAQASVPGGAPLAQGTAPEASAQASAPPANGNAAATPTSTVARPRVKV